MNNLKLAVSKTVSLSFFVLLVQNGFTQSLPNKQVNSLRLTNVKIDGISNEIENKYQAYNKATLINYSMANDDENLYLFIKSSYRDVSDKILRGGVTLKVISSTNKKDSHYISISYPVLEGKNESDVANFYARKDKEKREQKNSTINVDDLNKVLEVNSKSIKVCKNNENACFEISVYNEEGIHTISKFDSQLGYIYELSIPLKYLNFSSKSEHRFNYNIKINAINLDKKIAYDSGPPSPPVSISSVVSTDFSGEYTLLKK